MDSRSTKHSSTNNIIELLPNELNQEIFTRLIIKDLLRFRSVSKPWKAFIDSHAFKKTFYESSKTSSSTHLLWRKSYTGHNPTLHLFSPLRANDQISSFDIDLGEFFDDNDDIDVNILPFNGGMNLSCKKFGVVNGFMCFCWDSLCGVWNPFTKEYKTFNAPPKNWEFDLLNDCGFNDDVMLNEEIFAFGFDPISQDYKFLVAYFTSSMTTMSKNNDNNKVLYKVYSIKNNTWKGFVLGFSYVGQVISGDGYMDNGKFYWYVTKCGGICVNGTLGHGLLCFDFVDEYFELMPLSEELPHGVDMIAVANRGCLEMILTLDDDEDEHLRGEVWVMENGGLWVKKLAVNLAFDEVGRPIGVSKDGELMFEMDTSVSGVKELMMVDPISGGVKKFGALGTEYRLFSYVESLFSIRH